MEAIEKGEIFIISDIEEQIVQLADARQEGSYRDSESKAFHMGMLDSLSKDNDINHNFNLQWLKFFKNMKSFL